MREIKFRVWNPHGKVMDYAANEINTRGTNVVAEVKDGKVIAEYMPSGGVWKPAELMQYTGLKDRNGVEIYEGDIIACKFYLEYHERINWDDVDIVALVTWDLCGFGLDATNAEGDRRYPQLCDLNFEKSEVIGNIYENPELLDKAVSRE